MKISSNKSLVSCLFTLIVTLSLSVPSTLSATTLLYYRFGNQPAPSGYEINSGTLAVGLTGTATTTEYTLPGSGAGSQFSNPVPQTGEANSVAAQFVNDNARLSAATGQLGLGDSFTIEAFVNLTSFSTSTRMIASQWLTTGDQRSWTFGVGTDQKLRLTVSANGSASVPLISDQSFSLNKDYYVAAVFNQGGVTFYQQNLTDGGGLLTQTIGHTIGDPTAVLNATGTFQIGNFNFGDGNANQVWKGIIDEVRLSNVSLGSGDLLITPIPEPSTFVMLIASAALGVVFFRRRVLFITQVPNRHRSPGY